MKRLGITSDAPSWSMVSEISKEMRTLESALVLKYSDLEVDFVFCFRCLKKEAGWKSKARLYKNEITRSDGEPCEGRSIGLDIVCYEEDFVSIKKDKDAQRRLLGNSFAPFFQEVVKKYGKKMAISKDVTQNIMTDVQSWLLANKWI